MFRTTLGCGATRRTPGRHIYHGCIEDPLGERSLTVSETARKIGVSRVALSRVLNGRARISVSLALKLAAAGWGTADSWLRRQAQKRWPFSQVARNCTVDPGSQNERRPSRNLL